MLTYPTTYFGSSIIVPEFPDSLSNLNRWYDLDDFSTLTINSGDIEEIADKSSSNLPATAPNSFLRPPYVASSFNSNPGAQFDGGRRMTASSLPMLGAWTMFVVTSGAQFQAGQIRFITQWSSNSNLRNLNMGTTTGWFSSPVDSTQPAFSSNSNTNMYMTIVKGANNGDPVFTRMNGVLELSGVTSNTRTGNGEFVIGGILTSAEYVGFLHEFMFYDRALTGSEINSIEAYILNKWGPF